MFTWKEKIFFTCMAILIVIFSIMLLIGTLVSYGALLVLISLLL